MRPIVYVAFGVLVLDQLTKWFAIGHLSGVGSLPIIPRVFHLTLVENSGIAFGLFQGKPHLLTALITFCMVILVMAAKWFRDKPLPKRIAFGMILGGAFGNWVDRVRLQHVTDFLDFQVWPVFNVADSFITVGICLLLWWMIRAKRVS